MNENEKTLEALVEAVRRLHAEVVSLTKRTHFQEAEIEALRVYAVAKIADLLKMSRLSDRKGEFAAFGKILREVYDAHISKLESIDPALASEADLRAEMTEQDQASWYLLDKYFPEKGDPKG
jgi:hypothetical protein